MANQDIFGLDRKKARRADKAPDSSMKRIRYRVDPFGIAEGDVERVKKQTQFEKHPLEKVETPNNEVETPTEDIRRKKEEE